MTITALTATYRRPAALRLCEQYMARQTRAPDQWLVLDGPEPMPQKVLAALSKVTSDCVVWFEDDDWVSPGWLAWCVAQMERGFDLAGEGNAVYYNVAHRWWSECRNVRHAALCQTVIRSDLLDIVANVIRSYQSPFFDTRLWMMDCNRYLMLPSGPTDRPGQSSRPGQSDQSDRPNPTARHDQSARHVVGIKGISAITQDGRTVSDGYSGEHRERAPAGTNPDPSLMQLFRWIGRDAQNYRDFLARTV